MSVTTEAVTIEGPAGVLEALYEVSDESPSPAAIAVVCHPHPLHGGTMTNKVAYMLARALVELGAAAVRFNFRGVGASGGQYADGVGEVDDALAVVDWAHRRHPQAGIWLAGFSFGGAVAVRASIQREVQQLVLVAPAVEHFDVSDVHPPCPCLVVQGDADELVPELSVRHWVQTRDSEVTLLVEPGVGHFFHGKLVQLKKQLHANLAGRVGWAHAERT